MTGVEIPAVGLAAAVGEEDADQRHAAHGVEKVEMGFVLLHAVRVTLRDKRMLAKDARATR